MSYSLHSFKMHCCQFTMTWATALHHSFLVEILSGHHTINLFKRTKETMSVLTHYMKLSIHLQWEFFYQSWLIKSHWNILAFKKHQCQLQWEITGKGYQVMHPCHHLLWISIQRKWRKKRAGKIDFNIATQDWMWFVLSLRHIQGHDKVVGNFQCAKFSKHRLRMPVNVL